MDVHPTKNGMYRYWSIAIYCHVPCEQCFKPSHGRPSGSRLGCFFLHSHISQPKFQDHPTYKWINPLQKSHVNHWGELTHKNDSVASSPPSKFQDHLMKGHCLGDVEGMWRWREIHQVQLLRPLLPRRKAQFVQLLEEFPTPHFRDSTPGGDGDGMGWWGKP